ncbi:MAG: bbp38, partial [Polaromonas sp.]|nr:bbp38 [Polaromonas sp.]
AQVPDIHAKLCSPSGAEGWFACPGRVVMEAPFPDKGSEYSADGTARHEICAFALIVTGGRVADHVGQVCANGVTYQPQWVEEDQDYVDTIRALAADGGELFVERVVNFERFTEVPGDSFGTADAIVLKPLGNGTHELIVADRKTGYHEVDVERNKQLQLYALGAYDEFRLAYDISRVRLVIHQRAAREWDCSIEQLLAFAQEARSRAITVQNAVAMHGDVDPAEWERTFLNQAPTEDACRYCKAMATCPSMQRTVQDVVGADFADLDGIEESPVGIATADRLADAMAAAGLIEDFIKAVRAEVERRLLAGTEVPGFKLVLGKAGARRWADAAAAEEMLRKTFRLPVEKAYDLSLISPTTAEKLHKAGEIGKRQWPKLQPLIGRSDPKPSVAPVTDKRDAWAPTPVADDFQQLPEAETAGADLA